MSPRITTLFFKLGRPRYFGSIFFFSLYGWISCASGSATGLPILIKRENPTLNLKSFKVVFYCPKRPSRYTLILVPGLNGNGESLANRSSIVEFCQEENVCLAAITFVGKGFNWDSSAHYSNSRTGSGALLFEQIRALRKRNDLEIQPHSLLLIGFSAGARFVSSFVDEFPNEIMSWSAHSSGKWEKIQSFIKKGCFAPGIVSAGQHERITRYRSLHHFQLRCNEKQRVTWIRVRNGTHEWSESLETFTLAYFRHAILTSSTFRNQTQVGNYYDIDNKKQLDQRELSNWPFNASWLPNDDFYQTWKYLHYVKLPL